MPTIRSNTENLVRYQLEDDFEELQRNYEFYYCHFCSMGPHIKSKLLDRLAPHGTGRFLFSF